MSIRWRRIRRSISPRLLISLFIAVLILWATLPYDNAIRLSVRFNISCFVTFLTSTSRSERWLYQPPKFPVDWSKDVAIILKTGYGTQERAAAWLEALPAGISLDSVLVVSDFAALELLGKEVVVHDAVAHLESALTSTVPLSSQYPRLNKWARLRTAVLRGEDETARGLSKSFGWELDAVKFIPGLELAYSKMPNKKWVILVDDDTYLVHPSLDLVLSHYDSSLPNYIGNAVGDYRHRFGHGGSSIILSQAAMHRLFSSPGGQKAVANARVRSLAEQWGDRLLADTLMQIGIYIDEGTGRFFNGEQPWASRLREDNVCSPMATFHRLTTKEMEDVARTFKKAVDPVLWIDIWDIFNAPTLESFIMTPLRQDWDHVGRLDEHTTTVGDVAMAQKCRRLCYNNSKACLAWTWEEQEKLCHMSPWMSTGQEAKSKWSGPNVPRAKNIADVCR